MVEEKTNLPFFNIIDRIRVFDGINLFGTSTLDLSPNTTDPLPYSSTRIDGDTVTLMLDVDTFKDPDLLFILLLQRIIECITTILFPEELDLRKFISNFVSLKILIKEDISIEGKELSGELQFLQLLNILKELYTEEPETIDEAIGLSLLEFMAKCTYYQGLMESSSFVKKWKESYETKIKEFYKGLELIKKLLKNSSSERTEWKSITKEMISQLQSKLKLVYTFTGAIRILETEKLPLRLKRMITAPIWVYTQKEQLEDYLKLKLEEIKDKEELYCILLDKEKIPEDLRDKWEKIIQDLRDSSRREINVVYSYEEIPENVPKNRSLYLIDPFEIKTKERIMGIFYLPDPYMSEALYMATDVLIAEGRPEEISPVTKQYIKQ